MTEWNKKREIILHYDSLATIYDTQYAEEQDAKIKALLHEIKLKPDYIILDIGCGTGLLFPYIANRVQLLLGIDVSRILLKKAETRKKRYLNTHTLLADADHLPFKSQTFHTVFAITLLQNIPEPSTTLQEISRVSKNHAIIAVTGLKKEFTKKSFTTALKNAKLKISILKTENNLKDYIATCHIKN